METLIAKFLPGTRVRTPSGRYARIDKHDEEGRVHLTYYDGDNIDGHAETTCFPAKLLSDRDIVQPVKAHAQNTCGHGDRALEAVYDMPNTRAIIGAESDSPIPVWTYDTVGRKRGA